MVNNDQIHPTKKASCNCNKYFRIIGLICWPEYQRKKKKKRRRRKEEVALCLRSNRDIKMLCSQDMVEIGF
jgi:hypothetical protein